MPAVSYRLHLEGVVPESDEERVRAFLRRIFGDEIARLPYAELFPREVPGEFSFQRASEWMEALGRAGVRTRVEVQAARTEPKQSLSAPAPLSETLDAGPLQIWWNLLRRPEQTFGQLRSVPPMQLLLLSVVFIIAGEILSWPGELLVVRRISGGLIESSSMGHLLLSWLVLTPVARLLAEALLLWFVLRLLGVACAFFDTLLIAGLAHAAAPLQVVPVLGTFAAVVLWVWLAAIGAAVWYDLSRPRAVALAAAPYVFVMLPFVLFGALIVAIAITSGPVMLEGLETMPWPK